MIVKFSYLEKQFSELQPILDAIKRVASRGDFTLGEEVVEFEEEFARLCETKFAIGVNSGTDAIFLSLKALGIGPGDEVITVPNTFFATVGAIVAVGAKPVFVDVDSEYLIDCSLIERAVTSRTRAIIPVHLTGNICDMDNIDAIAKKHGLFVIEDACQAVGAAFCGQPAGSFGDTGAFSLHPLKNLNVWGDGGMITTNSEELCFELRQWRNHGLSSRDVCEFYAYNSRLSTVQAAVGLEVIKSSVWVTDKRVESARYYDLKLSTIPEISLPSRPSFKEHVFHLYIIMAEKRDELLQWLSRNGVEAKIHYPIPLHLQPATVRLGLGYKKGDFPVCESQADKIISLPFSQYISYQEMDYVADKIKSFYYAQRP